MAQKSEKTYTKKEVKKMLAQQVETCKQAIDTDNMSVVTARKKLDNVKLVVDAEKANE